ncbi:HAMP domain-containing sensor histidine kinase [Bordetella sp. 15P40C-2]|uniref:sensor histidine kinase n=1 Tax=Bordetella sp. 15P40C-2 TaxID=2572246 RepID=UPI00132B8657|nr:HAMP domain-containing sensor histidine kinase [Bordetella sp. 15P40C-2]MVW73580.1 HAMP domain-containing protein [Bordetella sp. 15P40C-2]
MIRRLGQLFNAISNSVAFRLTLNYSVLALLTSLVSLMFVYYQSVKILESQFSRQVQITAQRMNAHYEQGGLAGLANEITLEMADHVNSDTEMFMLLDPIGRMVVGNIAWDPSDAPLNGSGVMRSVLLRGEPAHGYLVARTLPDGSTLIIGHDLRDLYELTDLIRTVSLAATGVIALLVLLGAALFRRVLQRRVEVIRRTAAQVGAGQWGQRIPAHPTQDEFAMLSNDINGMLDRIEQLMHGVRNVSDAVAHQLRTPLTRMQARLRTIDWNGAPREEIRANVERLSAELDDLVKISEKLLHIAELESGARRKDFEPIRLDTIAHDVVDLYEAVAEEQNAELWLDSSTPAPMRGDPDLLAGALATLVDNSLKYAGAHARIQITITQNSHQTTLTVTDNGPGIPPEKLPRIGERFYRAHRHVPGYGLGLTTVMAITRLHDGTMTLHNAEPGLCVRLIFPQGSEVIAASA